MKAEVELKGQTVLRNRTKSHGRRKDSKSSRVGNETWQKYKDIHNETVENATCTLIEAGARAASDDNSVRNPTTVYWKE